MTNIRQYIRVVKNEDVWCLTDLGYQFLRAALINYCTWGIKQQKCILSQLEVRNIKLAEPSQLPLKALLLLLLLLLSCVSCVRLCVTPQMVAHQAPLSLGFSRQEHWSGLPFPSPMHESETTMCEIDSQWEAAVQHRELSSVLCDNLERWNGVGWEGGPRGRGLYVCIQLIPFNVQQRPTQHCKAIILNKNEI